VLMINMHQLFTDVRYGIRLLFSTKLTTAAAIVSLALGIAGTTAMFSVVDSVLLRPLPYAGPDRLVMVWATSKFGTRGSLSPADFLDYRNDARLVEGMASISASSMSLTGDGDPEQVRVQTVSGNFFTLLGVPALAGRTFVPRDDEPDAREQAMLGEGLWKKRYGQRGDIIGRQITLAGRRVEVVGIVPARFRFDTPADVWLLGHRGVPRGAAALGDMTKNRDISILTVVGRLRPGVAMQSAQAELDAIAARLKRMYPIWNTDRGVMLEPLQTALVGDTRTVLLVLLGAVVLLLLIASVNVANLLLVRTQGRTMELVMRSALGASRGRLAAQILIESVLLAAIGGVLGVLLAVWAVRVLVELAPTNLARIDEVSVNLRLLLFATAVTGLTGVAFGSWPAWRASRISLSAAMNAAARGSVGRERRRTQQLLVFGELAVALVLIVGAGLLVTSFARLLTIDTGFDPRRVIAVGVSLPSERYGEDPARKARFHETVLQRLRVEPGIDAAAMTLAAPMSPSINRGVWIEGQPDPPRGDLHSMRFQTISEDYFRLLGVPLRRGRAFASDDRADTLHVAIVNEAFTRRYFPGRDAMGQRIGFGGPNNPNYWRTIVGIAADTREGLASGPAPTAYIPYRQDGEPWNFGSYVVKSSLPTRTVGDAVRRAVLSADPDQPISRVRTIEEAMASGIAVQRFTTVLATLFASLALLLAAVGTFGVMSHVVSTRTREIGVRLALGAQRGDIIRMILGQALRVATGAAIAGVIAASLVDTSLGTLLFEVKPGDPRTLIGAVAVLIVTALAASYVPVRRALAQNPVGSLRAE
jgi:putative ABC transport system permease protein